MLWISGNNHAEVLYRLALADFFTLVKQDFEKLYLVISAATIKKLLTNVRPAKSHLQQGFHSFLPMKKHDFSNEYYCLLSIDA